MFHGEKHPYRGNSRTSSHEDKVATEDIKWKYKIVNYVEQEHKKWNTDNIETMELGNMTSQAALYLDDGEHATNLEKLTFTNTLCAR